MPVKEVKGTFEIEDALRTKTPLGFTVIYFFEEGTPVHQVLSPIYEEISRYPH
jgi:hypothetical protein